MLLLAVIIIEDIVIIDSRMIGGTIMIHGETTLAMAMVVTVGIEMIEDVRLTVIVRVLLQKDTGGGRLIEFNLSIQPHSHGAYSIHPASILLCYNLLIRRSQRRRGHLTLGSRLTSQIHCHQVTNFINA